MSSSYERWKRLKGKNELVRTTREIPDYRLQDGEVIRLVEVFSNERAVFKPQRKGDHRIGILRADEWEWRRPEWTGRLVREEL